MRILIGGSPCTHWSLAQHKNREVEPEGSGWELFRNFLIAIEKFQPDYFLYENNKSISVEIRTQISTELQKEPILINSSLVSAQSRQRFYWTNIPGVEQPKDKGIMLYDILENIRSDWRPVGEWTKRPMFHDLNRTKLMSLRTTQSEKSRTLTTSKGHPNNFICNPERTEYTNLTITEYEKLQTVPVGYTACVPTKERYKLIGNGWTVDVIAHILSYCPDITEKSLEVLSMYDGISCGQLALNRLGANVAHYYATEIDPYAIKVTQTNFPNTIQLGDAFQVRDVDWGVSKRKEVL